MDTAGYLANQGWRGEGHALHISGRGITKPIRISQKLDVFGVGKKKHDAHTDQWWVRAFDDTLKGLNTAKNDITGKTEGVSLGASARALQMAEKNTKWVGQGGLYSNFVKGEGLGGTMEPRNVKSEDPQDHRGNAASSSRNKKTRRHHEAKDPDQCKQTENESAQPRPVSPSKEHQLSKERKHIETKEERRQRRREKKARRAVQKLEPPGHIGIGKEDAILRDSAVPKVTKQERVRTEAFSTIIKRVKSAKRKKHKPASREEG